MIIGIQFIFGEWFDSAVSLVKLVILLLRSRKFFAFLTCFLLALGILGSFDLHLRYNGEPAIATIIGLDRFPFGEAYIFIFTISAGLILNRYLRGLSNGYKIVYFGLPLSFVYFIGHMDNAESVLWHHLLLLIVFTMIAMALFGGILIAIAEILYRQYIRPYIRFVHKRIKQIPTKTVPKK